jgi:acetolactate synthase-1/2/3 large subunit
MNRREWLSKCLQWRYQWPVITNDHYNREEWYRISLYAVLDHINRYSQPYDTIVADAGSISYAGPVALEAKEGQRLIFSPAQADMGWALPASIGVSKASGNPVICITGDGSFMSNLQELATIRKHNLNIKIIILNNEGYLSIKNTQQKYFQNRVYGTDANSGLGFPSFCKVANAFDIPHFDIRTIDGLGSIANLLRLSGPAIIECLCWQDEEILPAQGLKNGKQAPLHDMVPFLSDEEMKKEMINDY